MQHDLPQIRGEYVFDFPLKNISFAGVGGSCDVLFCPKDAADLLHFCKHKPADLPVIVLGGLTNTLAPDDGIRGCVVNLSRFMTNIEFKGGHAIVDAGAALRQFIDACIKKELACCEALAMIPGTVGGAIAMNAGVPGYEISWPMKSVICVDMDNAKLVEIPKIDLDIRYRNGNIPDGLIVVSAVFATTPKSRTDLEQIVESARVHRLQTQPVGARTCGCTFKNPQGSKKAWQLIKEAECDGLSVGGASVSNIHANFLLNSGNATTADFVALIEIIKQRVLEKTGVLLEEEVVILGK